MPVLGQEVLAPGFGNGRLWVISASDRTCLVRRDDGRFAKKLTSTEVHVSKWVSLDDLFAVQEEK